MGEPSARMKHEREEHEHEHDEERRVQPRLAQYSVMKEANVNQDEGGVLKHDQLEFVVPPGCVKENTTLNLSVNEDRSWDDPFKVAFNDGQQPQRPVEVFVRTAGDIDILKKSIVLCHLPNYEDGGQEEEVIDNAYFEEDGEDPEPKTIGALIPHFSWFKFTVKGALLDFNAMHVSENPEYSRKWTQSNEGLTNTKALWDRPNFVLGYLLPPLNTKSRAILINNFEQDWGRNVAILYHASNPKAIQCILQQGFKLPSQLGGVCPGHIQLNETIFGVNNWADAVFASVSPKYVMAPVYAGKSTLRKMLGKVGSLFVMCGMVKDNMVTFTMLQCRVKEQGLTKVPGEPSKLAFPGTIGDDKYNKCDGRMVKNGLEDQMECRVHDVNMIKPYRMLMGFIKRSELRAFFIDPDAIELAV